jgi:CubicO group peptidase (beta-lactamase class C family)
MTHRRRSALAASIFFFLLAARAGTAQPARPPDTPQGRRMAALIAAFGLGTPEAIRDFVSANFAASALKETPVEQRAERLSGMARETGPLEFHQVLRGEGPEIAFLARSKTSGSWVEIGMMLEPGPAFGIRGLRFEDSQGPGAPPEKPARSDAEAAAATGAQLRQLADRDEFSGVVLLAKNGKPFFHQAYGLANKDLGVLNRPDTKFNIGSINKMFTQMAIGQLLQQGKLALDDTIRKHLPDYPSPAADRITIQQLLTNTSGLGDIFGERYDATPKDRLRALSDFLPLFAADPLLFEPGASRRYSNAGYVVLGLLIEKLSGQGYHDYVREHIFAPAGMTNSDAYPQDAVVPNRAVGYTREGPMSPTPGPRRPNLYALPARSSSAGGGYSTAEDLLAFDTAVRGEKLLSPELTDWFLTDKSRPPAPAGSAAKQGRRARQGGGGFAGGTAGVNAVLEMDLDTGYTVVVLSNYDPPAAERVAKALRQRLGL